MKELSFEFVYQVNAKVLQAKKSSQGPAQPVIRRVCLPLSQLSDRTFEQISDLEVETEFGNVVSFKDETKSVFEVWLLDFISFEVEKKVQAIRPQMASFNHETLTEREIEQAIGKMLSQWRKNKAKRQNVTAGLEANWKRVEKDLEFEMPLGMKIFMKLAMVVFFRKIGGWEDVPLECRWDYLDEDKKRIETMKH